MFTLIVFTILNIFLFWTIHRFEYHSEFYFRRIVLILSLTLLGGRFKRIMYPPLHCRSSIHFKDILTLSKSWMQSSYCVMFFLGELRTRDLLRRGGILVLKLWGHSFQIIQESSVIFVITDIECIPICCLLCSRSVHNTCTTYLWLHILYIYFYYTFLAAPIVVIYS